MPHQHWLAAIPSHLTKIKLVVVFLGLIPLVELVQGYRQNTLGFDPLDRITRSTGSIALILLITVLAITPLRYLLTRSMILIGAAHGKRPSDWNWVIKLRRMLGLLSFFYATLHLGIYFWLDQGGNIADALRDNADRPYIAIGSVAFLMLVPLALTANDYSIRQLGKKWRLLHRMVYLILILTITHYWMLTKLGVSDPVPYVLIAVILLGWRIWFALKRIRSKIVNYSEEIPDRTGTSID